MTEQVTEDDLWLGECSACGERFQILDEVLIDAHPALMLKIDEVDEFLVLCTCGKDITLWRQITKVVPFAQMTVLPAASGCPECGVDHPPEMPHNWQTLIYQYTFRNQEARAGREERWPTIRDAMTHCTPEVQKEWIDALRERGVEVV